MRYLSSEEILAIHDRILFALGGLKGIRDLNLLQSIAERPKSGMMGQVFYVDLFSKAAVYLEGLATYHVFADGNKRSAITVAGLFLRANGYHLKFPQTEGYHFVIAVAQKQKSIVEITNWLKKYSKRIR